MPASEDPVTVIGLIFRIVDEPRRAGTLVLILLPVLLPVLAAVMQLAAPAARLAGLPLPAFWWSGSGLVGFGWLSRTTVRLIRRGKRLR
jgi:hypothetical protein